MTTARPLPLSALPRVSSAPPGASASGPNIAAILGTTAPLKMSPFGSGSLTCTQVVAPLAPDEGDAIWGLSRNDAHGHGYLLLDGMTALRLVAVTLGAPAPRMFRPLGTSERGIVTAVIASTLRSLRSDLAVSLGLKPWKGKDFVRIILSAEFHNMKECLRLDVPPSWVPVREKEDTAWFSEAKRRGLEIPMSVQIAHTTLTALEWSRARPGDAIVFDVASVGNDAGGWHGKLFCGSYAAEILIDTDGRVRLDSVFEPAAEGGPARQSAPAGRSEPTGFNQGNKMSDDSELSLTMLAAAPIEIVAEVGRMVMRADEVAALKPGMVLPIGPLTPRIVTLRVGERIWAEGELVDVDGQLGVRLTTMSAPVEARTLQSEDEETLPWSTRTPSSDQNG